MYVTVTFLIIVIQLPHRIKSFGLCSPNTQFIVNGFLCHCNREGHWNETNCKLIGRRNTCRPGDIVMRGCMKCTCQMNNNYICDNKQCTDGNMKIPISHQLSQYGPRCTPFRSYYVNCSLCTCPASGQTLEAQCAVDVSCTLLSNSADPLKSGSRCLPNVMYLFPCLQCLCSEQGMFASDKCVENCHKTSAKPIRRCIPGTLYRINCFICRCPESSIPDEVLCRSIECDIKESKPYLRSLKINNKCEPHIFSEPKCFYCDCTPEGTVNENSCIQLDCSETIIFNYESSKDVCSPGELVPICMECFCPRNRNIDNKYCTKTCSNQNKLDVLEHVLNDSLSGLELIDESELVRIIGNDKCIPNSLYLDEGRYCLCPKSASSEFKFCTLYYKHSEARSHVFRANSNMKINFNINCKPNTLIDFGCNTCFCSKNGNIDPKWCTYDDCESKTIVRESHKMHTILKSTETENITCTPGSISTVKCNFCICPDNGILKERVCTKNDCEDNESIQLYDKLTCEPLEYYEVDCNICFCPEDGLKNVAKCTKNPCETNFLRSDYCVPGHLFTDDCNVCVCPFNGNKEDKACTNQICRARTWNLFRAQPSFLSTNVKVKRNLDVCYPGEEYIDGCKVCVCPEVGFKAYAICENILCDNIYHHGNANTEMGNNSSHMDFPHVRKGRDIHGDCFIYNQSNSDERKECTPGSMYIIRCKECICPYAGSINSFCRPLPKSVYCEQAFPGFNFLPMGRRNIDKTSKNHHYVSKDLNIKHNHTKYTCGKSGRIIDKCFICECEDNVVIEEHCFRSDAPECLHVTPSFLIDSKVIII